MNQGPAPKTLTANQAKVLDWTKSQSLLVAAAAIQRQTARLIENADTHGELLLVLVQAQNELVRELISAAFFRNSTVLTGFNQ